MTKYVLLACLLLVGILLTTVRTICYTVHNISKSEGNFKIIVSVVNGVLYAFLIFLIVFHVNDYQQRKKDNQIYDSHKSGLFTTLTYKETREAFHILKSQDPFSTDLIAVNNDGIDIPPITEFLEEFSIFEPKIIVYCNEGADWYTKKGLIKVGSYQCYDLDEVVKITPDYAGMLIIFEIFTFFVIVVFNFIGFEIIKENLKSNQLEEQA